MKVVIREHRFPKYQTPKNLWASFKPASADLILCFFSRILFTFSRFTVGWRDSLNSFQHFMKLVPLFTCVQYNTYMWDSCTIYTLFLCVWDVYCIYNSHFYLKLGLQLKYIHTHTSSPGVFHKEIKNIVDWFISDPLAYYVCWSYHRNMETQAHTTQTPRISWVLRVFVTWDQFIKLLGWKRDQFCLPGHSDVH